MNNNLTTNELRAALLLNFMNIKPINYGVGNYGWSNGVFYSVLKDDYDECWKSMVSYASTSLITDWNFIMSVVKKVNNTSVNGLNIKTTINTDYVKIQLNGGIIMSEAGGIIISEAEILGDDTIDFVVYCLAENGLYDFQKIDRDMPVKVIIPVGLGKGDVFSKKIDIQGN